MEIYFFLLGLIIFLGLSKLKHKNSFIFIILFLVSALRFDVGYDYISYYNVINYLDKNNYNRFGIIDQLLINISRSIDFYQFYFIATSFFVIYLITVTLKKFSENYFFSILIFITIPIFYLLSFSIIRQFVAISIVFYSLRYIVKRNLLKYLLLIFVAFLFHISAIIATPIYFLYRNKFSKKFAVLLLLLLSFFLSSVLVIIIQKYMPIYASYIYESARFGKNLFYFFVLIYIFVLMNYKYIRNNNASFFFNTFTVGLCLYAMTIQLGEVAPRASYYYLIFIIVLIPSILKFYKTKQIYFIMLFVTIILYSFNFYLFAKNEHKNPYVPYHIFFLIDEENYNWK